MLHQRTTRRQPGEVDPHDPTTTVYSSGGTGGGYGGSNPAYGGYGGYGNTGPSNTTPYGGGGGANGSSSSSSSPGLYDKNRKKKQSFYKTTLQKLQDPLFVVSMIAIICFLFAVRYKLAHQHVHRNYKTQNAGDLHSISRHRDTLQKELLTVKESHKKQAVENKKFQTELMKLQQQQNKRGGGSSSSSDVALATETVTKLEAREKAWKKQYELLKTAVIKESRRSILDKYGNPPYYCEFTVAISVHNKDDHEEGVYDEVVKSFTVEMASLDEMPHAVHLFMEQVAHKLWDNGWFYLNGPHVFQAGPQIPDEEEYETALSNGADERMLATKPFKDLQLDSLAFPEYSDKFPHVQWTLGYTGRPGGPDFYINKVDNSKAHGPGGQTHHDLVEHADPCFAKVIDGMDTIELMRNSPTIRGQDDAHRYFFEEPVQIVKVRIVQHPNKVMDLNKIAEAMSESRNVDGQAAAAATAAAAAMKSEIGTASADRVEVTMGDVKVPEHTESHTSEQQQQQQQHQRDEQEYQGFGHHNDEEQMEQHHRARHRKHPKLSNLLPEHTVEA